MTMSLQATAFRKAYRAAPDEDARADAILDLVAGEAERGKADLAPKSDIALLRKDIEAVELRIGAQIAASRNALILAMLGIMGLGLTLARVLLPALGR